MVIHAHVPATTTTVRDAHPVLAFLAGAAWPAYPDVYAVGDVTSVGTPKASVFAEGQAAVVANEIIARHRRVGSASTYDGTGICYIEFGHEQVARVEVAVMTGEQPNGRFDDPSWAYLADNPSSEPAASGDGSAVAGRAAARRDDADTSSTRSFDANDLDIAVIETAVNAGVAVTSLATRGRRCICFAAGLSSCRTCSSAPGFAPSDRSQGTVRSSRWHHRDRIARSDQAPTQDDVTAAP